jgi:hypothetical protein
MGAPPWKLLAPFVPGAPLGDGWVIESLSTVSHGSATLVLQHSRKGEARISVCPNVGAPRGIAHTEHLDFLLMNEGTGNKPTESSIAAALVELAARLQASGLSKEQVLAEFAVRSHQAPQEDRGRRDANREARLSPELRALLAGTAFQPAHEEWLDVRDRDLAARLEALAVERPRKVLLVNATHGVQYYASVIDFFAQLQRIHSRIQCVSSSYFENVREYHEDVVTKGLDTVPMADLMTWDAAALNRYDVVLFFGASDALARIIALPGVRAKLVLLHIGFYHQLLEAHPNAFLAGERIADLASQSNHVFAYSSDPLGKVTKDLAGTCSHALLHWRWLSYIPIGFTYREYFVTETRAFDVALLGSNARDYTHLDAALFRGVRFLFLGASENAPGLDQLRAKAEVTVVSGVDHHTYARLLALCRCAVFPMASWAVKNSFLSLVDSVASGKPVVTRRHEGLDRLVEDGLPAHFYEVWSDRDERSPRSATPPLSAGTVREQTARSAYAAVASVLEDDACPGRLEPPLIAFARKKMDIYRVLWTILQDQIL